MRVRVERSRIFGFFSLFTSVGTLVCCALPSLFVLLGMGATVASVLSSAPWLVSLSRHKEWVFAGSGIMIAANFWYLYFLAPRLKAVEGAACDPAAPEACDTATRFSRAVLWGSAMIWLAGFSVAFVLGPILMRLDT